MQLISNKNIQDSILSYLNRLIAFDTQNPPRNLTADSEIFAYLKSAVEELGFRTSIIDHDQGRVTFYAVRGTPDLIFNVHIDTVPAVSGWKTDPHTLLVTDTTATGLGACDIKSAAACLLTLAEQDDRELALLFTTDEEGANGHCVKAFVETDDARKYKQAIVAEPTQCKAVVEHSGFVSVAGVFYGFAGHSSDLNALAKSALHASMRWGSKALQYVDESYANNSRARFNIGRLDGGVKSNITANEASVCWSARLLPGSDTQSFVNSINACAPRDAQVDWRASFYGEPLPNAEFDNDQARVFIEQHGLEMGEPVGFWTEAAIFHQAGIPAIVLGPGNIAQAHTANEWVSLSDLLAAYTMYERVSR